MEIKNIKRNVLIFECPTCHYMLEFHPGESFVKCPCCSSMVNITQKPKTNTIDSNVEKITSITAGKTYIQFLFERFDWQAFGNDPQTYTIAEIDILLKNLQTIRGDDKDTWKMSFDYLLICIKQKVKYLKQSLTDLVDKFISGADDNSCHNRFDNLKECILYLGSKRADIVSELERYIEFAERQGIDKNIASSMQNAAMEIDSLIDSVSVTKTLEDYPLIKEALDKRLAEIEEKYLAKGIDAKEVYARAIENYNSQEAADALEKFSRIHDYQDSEAYIDRMTKCVLLNDKIIFMHNHFYFRDNNILYKENEKLIDYNNALTLPYEEGITCFGDFYYYLDSKDNKKIHFFDVNDEVDKHKKRVPIQTITLYGKPRILGKANGVKRPDKLLIEITVDPLLGCKERDEYFNRHNLKKQVNLTKKNKYPVFRDIFELDLRTGIIVLLLEGINEVKQYDNDIIYYTGFEFDTNKKGKATALKCNATYSYNVETMETNLEIPGDSKICNINKDNSIVFTRNDHGQNNYSIYTKHSINDTTELEVAKNVYKFYKVINNKIYYMIGNENVKSLCAINQDGTGYQEIMKYMQEVVFNDDEWLYIVRGDNKEGYRTLYRIPTNASNATPVKIAFGIHINDLSDNNRIIANGYLYYRNFNNILCRVRLNGSGYQELVMNVEKVLSVAYNKVFYISIDSENNRDIESLYCMDFDGSNRQKLVYDVLEIQSIDEDTYVYIRKEHLENKSVIYEEVEDSKLQKQIHKMYRKIEHRHKDPSAEVEKIYRFECSDMQSYLVGYYEKYPTTKLLRQELKEVLTGKVKKVKDKKEKSNKKK